MAGASRHVVKSPSRPIAKLSSPIDHPGSPPGPPPIVPVFGFEKLEVYQMARHLSGRLGRLAKLLPSEERFRLKVQIERARLSLTNAISEGHGRYTYKDRKHYCYEARGSLQELVDDINECKEMEYAKPEHLDDLKWDAFRVLQMIDGWARYLEKQRAQAEKQRRLKKRTGSPEATT